MKKNDPNFNLSKDMIADALIRLLVKKDFAKITVKEITDEAQLARRTFYKHFELKEDVIKYKMLQVNEAFQSSIKGITIDGARGYGYYFFSFFKQHSETLIILNRQNLLLTVAYYLHMSYMTENPEVVERLRINSSKYNLAYRFGGIFFMLIEWISNGFEETPEEMARLFSMEISSPD